MSKYFRNKFPGFLPAIIFNVIFACSAQEVHVHDPVVIREGDTFHMYCTGYGISHFSAQNLAEWQYRGPVFEDIPVWTREHVSDFKGHIWAPDIFYWEGTYYLYYSISSFAKNTSCIGVVTNKTLDPDDSRYQWKDHGIVIESVPGRDLWNAIDPNIIRDKEGRIWMSFGSFWEGIKLVRLDSTLTKPHEPQQWHTLARRERSFQLPDEEPGDGAVEAPFIILRNGKYYLFVSFDYCCRGIESSYKIAVGRSENIQGPYLDQDGRDLFYGGGTILLEGSGRWAALGHNAILREGGTDYLVYHAYDRTNEGKPVLQIKELNWTADGWPVVTLTEEFELK